MTSIGNCRKKRIEVAIALEKTDARVAGGRVWRWHTAPPQLPFDQVAVQFGLKSLLARAHSPA